MTLNQLECQLDRSISTAFNRSWWADSPTQQALHLLDNHSPSSSKSKFEICTLSIAAHNKHLDQGLMLLLVNNLRF